MIECVNMTKFSFTVASGKSRLKLIRIMNRKAARMSYVRRLMETSRLNHIVKISPHLTDENDSASITPSDKIDEGDLLHLRRIFLFFSMRC